MTYKPLILPVGIRSEVERLIRDQLESLLVDVHAMLRLPIDNDPGLRGGCNLSATLVLLSVVAGVSVTVYGSGALSRRGDRGTLFEKVLIDHYPWSEEGHIEGAQLDANAANALYRIFRNPLSHTLGLVDSQDNPSGQRVVIEKGPNPEDFIERLERAPTRPPEWTEPTLRVRQNELVLWVAALYWGVRRMIYNVASIPTSQTTSISITQPPALTWRST